MTFFSRDLPFAFARARLEARIAAQLEQGRGLDGSREPGPLGELGARLYEQLQRRSARRALLLPASVSAVAIGGATLGGSYKTPLAIACAKALRESGASVVLVGHGYAATPTCARRVTRMDPRNAVGDEALLAVSVLAPFDIPVVVAERRSSAIAYASTLGDVLVVDGTTHLRGGAKLLRVLSVAASEPFGSGRVFPLGNLRASKETLLGSADCLAPIAIDDSNDDAEHADAAALAHLQWPSSLAAPQLKPDARFGLFTAIARPDRVLRALRNRGVHPHVVLQAPNHRGETFVTEARRVAAAHALDAWVTTSKCALSLGEQWIGAPRHTLTLDLSLTPTFLRRLRVWRDGS